MLLAWWGSKDGSLVRKQPSLWTDGVEHQFFFAAPERCQGVRQNMRNFQGLKCPMLFVVEPVTIIISGLIAGPRNALERFGTIEFPCHGTTMAVAGEACAAERRYSLLRPDKLHSSLQSCNSGMECRRWLRGLSGRGFD